ncbi:flagellar biosynthetic protein FliR [Desulfohalobium retbaense]|uniref:Flagellar biosynthetic protein FliR n=1 Tax=Desulfohalobium retbaense (strain ATCC 49708 / DSM 5692 / JCM 16813 / HR100) TaxID=485915 RepID=C8WYW7_DESRD|nr:flagellar biosynthetic protein FliR [Desulfohalobium retbaense]ACV67883.1 flagellar biosynthetic protein FliR [Desulfohalobium retbaense DSM 5692]
MDLEALLSQHWPSFLLCFIRVAAIIGSMPVLSGGQTPARLRAGLALVLAVIIFPAVDGTIPDINFAPLRLFVLGSQEVLLGLMLGFIGRLLFLAAQFGGTILGFQMGFAAANILDPQSQQQIQLMSQFQNVLASLVFLAVDGHHVFLRSLARSFEVVPPGGGLHLQDAVPSMVAMTGEMFVLGLQLTAPIYVILILSDFILGIMSRIFPQLNAFMLKFPINIGVAFFFLGLSAEFIVSILISEFNGLAQRLVEFFELVRQ